MEQHPLFALISFSGAGALAMFMVVRSAWHDIHWWRQ